MGNGYSRPKSLADRLTLSLFGSRKLSVEEVKEYFEERESAASIGKKEVDEILDKMKDGMIEAKYIKKEDHIAFRVGKMFRKKIGDDPEIIFVPKYV